MSTGDPGSENLSVSDKAIHVSARNNLQAAGGWNACRLSRRVGSGSWREGDPNPSTGACWIEDICETFGEKCRLSRRGGRRFSGDPDDVRPVRVQRVSRCSCIPENSQIRLTATLTATALALGSPVAHCERWRDLAPDVVRGEDVRPSLGRGWRDRVRHLRRVRCWWHRAHHGPRGVLVRDAACAAACLALPMALLLLLLLLLPLPLACIANPSAVFAMLAVTRRRRLGEEGRAREGGWRRRREMRRSARGHVARDPA